VVEIPTRLRWSTILKKRHVLWIKRKINFGFFTGKISYRVLRRWFSIVNLFVGTPVKKTPMERWISLERGGV
jgi:hypothetical protein